DFLNRDVSPYGGVQLFYGDSSHLGLCVASSSNNALPFGGCSTIDPPSNSAWHNFILRYSGTGPRPGQGGHLPPYLDGALVFTGPNDSNNDPIFNSTVADTIDIGADSITLDEVTIYSTTFTDEDQCRIVIGGTWDGAHCTLP